MKDFEIHKLLYESAHSRIYLIREDGKSDDYILKQSKLSDKAGLYNEVSLLKQVDEDGLSPRLAQYETRPGLVRKFYEGMSLRQYLNHHGAGIKIFKDLAIPLARALDSLHQKGIIHKDISPDNFIVEPQSKTVHLIDLEAGAPLLNSGALFDQRRSVEGTLHYISPELTGRMNRQVDYRSDYYSLGAVYYELLCGKTMFDTDDELALIHCHIAMMPPAVHELNPEIHPAAWEVVSKLLSKNGEDRYQSIAGLYHDLDIILQLGTESEHKGFVPGMRDLSPRLNVSQKLVGREQEIQLITELYEQAGRSGKVVLGLKGSSGVGKTSLIRESGKLLATHGGLFVSGKFELMNRSIPYFAWSQVLNQLADILLAESQEHLNRSRDLFTENMQGLEGVVIAIAPRWKLFFREIRDLQILNPKEQQNRVQHAVAQFVFTLLKIHKPLLVFLDDWQWADEASVDLLDSLCRDHRLKGLFLALAWRDHEVDSGHIFVRAMTEISNMQSKEGADTNMNVREVLLRPLRTADTHELLSQTFPRHSQEMFQLSDLVHNKTSGNPFFINQLLEYLFNRNKIRMNLTTGTWEWDMEEIQSFGMMGDVADLIIAKIKESSAQNLEILTYASCLGNSFDFASLVEITDEGEEELHVLLWKSYRENLIECLTPDYKFVPDYYSTEGINLRFKFTHDRIQQSLYQLANDQLRKDLHFRAAEFALRRGFELDEVFSVANHIVEAGERIKESQRFEDATEQLLKAAGRSFLSGAHDSAFFFFTHYRKLKGSQHPLKLQEYSMMIESAFLSSHESEIPSLVNEALSNARDKYERAAVFNSLIKGNTAVNKHKEAIDIAKRAFAELGFKLPKGKAGLPSVILSSIKTQIVLPDKKIDSISGFPIMQNPASVALMDLMYNSLPAFFFVENETYPLVIFKMVRESKRKGNSPGAIVGYGSYGLILAAILNKPVQGYAIAEQATKLIESLGAHHLDATAGFINGMFIKHLREPIFKFEDQIFHDYERGLQAGDLFYAAVNLYNHACMKLFRGQNLNELAGLFKSVELFGRRYNQLHILAACVAFRSVFERMMISAPPDMRDNEEEKEIRRQLEEEKNEVMHFGFDWIRSFMGVLNLRYAEALPHLARNEKNYGAMAGAYWERISRATKCAARVNAVFEGILTEKEVLKSIQKDLNHLRKFEKIFDGNVGWIISFLEAESATLKDKKLHSSLYRKAAEKARANRFEFPAVMIELMFLQKMIYLKDTQIKPYWDALKENLDQLDMKSVIASWEEKFPELRSVSSSGTKISPARGEVNAEKLDAKTIIKSAEVLSGEIALDKVSSRMLRFAMENAGADYGCFYALQNGEFRMLTEHHMDTGNQRKVRGIPDSVKNLVIRTGEVLLLDDASVKSPFDRDELIIGSGEKSLLCIPIIQHQQCIGLLYLGNRLLKGAFTEERIAIIRMLAGQMGISLQHAILFDDMEKQVAQRTDQLSAEKSKSDALLLNILPREIAAELKEKGKAIPRQYESATVMFCDIQNFTSLAETMGPSALIEELDMCFKAFDEIVASHGIEKIKTIGDAYLCASGIPSYTPDHAVRAVKAALEIQEWMQKKEQEMSAVSRKFFKLRVGLHCGPLVAGVVGNLKFAYDIWGDTVNTAARMEQNGETGKVNISEAMYQQVKDLFHCEYRGEIEVKNKGKQKMYFVEAPESVK